MNEVMTVLGPIDAEELGKVMIHEHFTLTYPGAEWDPQFDAACVDAFGDGMQRITALKDRGIATIVDPLPMELGRDPQLLVRLGENGRRGRGRPGSLSVEVLIQVRGSAAAIEAATSMMRNVTPYSPKTSAIWMTRGWPTWVWASDAIRKPVNRRARSHSSPVHTTGAAIHSGACSRCTATRVSPINTGR